MLGFIPVMAQRESRYLASRIANDTTLQVVDRMAHDLLREGFNAGSGYSQVWCRDLNTFIEAAMDVNPASDIKGAIKVFYALQCPNGEMIDGYVLQKDFNWGDDHAYHSTLSPNHVGFKNSVETDQETSLIQLVCKFVTKSGDKSFLQERVGDRTIMQRNKDMLAYLKRERYNEKYGLIYGATTADWGDVQPCTDNVVDIDSTTDFAIDIYDNAMLIIALDDLCRVAPDDPDVPSWKQWAKSLRKNVRKYLWDKKNQKFIPHIYLDKSPIPADFDESKVYYHGGTAVAIEAGLLSKKEIAISNQKMLENVKQSGMPTIGLTLYPVYPEGFFHGGMAKPYVYQNGGDWTWFGGRMIQQLIRNGFVQEAYDEVRPMIDRVIKNKGFYEWYGPGNRPDGSGRFKGSAGVLSKAIEMFQEWSRQQLEK